MLLVMKAESPLDGKIYYFIDKCLPFGAAISCSHFQAFSDALAHIVRIKAGNQENINYLDDFLFAAAVKLLCDQNIQLFLNVCRDIRFPVSLDKTHWGTTQLTFLGLFLDTIRQMIYIPIDKINKALHMIDELLSKKKATLKTIQQLCGVLNFFSKAIVPARTFTRRLYAMTAGSTICSKLRQHHHIKLAADVKMDLEIWRAFLLNSSAYSRPFSDFTELTALDIDFFTDSSANPELGCGGVCNKQWFVMAWDSVFVINNRPSINYLELYAVTIAVMLWIHQFANMKIALFCDNMSVVNMINNSTSSCKNCMVLIRMIVLQGLLHNVKITARHVPGKFNKFADHISRMRIDRFKEISNGKYNDLPVSVPDNLKNMSKLWLS